MGVAISGNNLPSMPTWLPLCLLPAFPSAAGHRAGWPSVANDPMSILALLALLPWGMVMAGEGKAPKQLLAAMAPAWGASCQPSQREVTSKGKISIPNRISERLWGNGSSEESSAVIRSENAVCWTKWLYMTKRPCLGCAAVPGLGSHFVQGMCCRCEAALCLA